MVSGPVAQLGERLVRIQEVRGFESHQVHQKTPENPGFLIFYYSIAAFSRSLNSNGIIYNPLNPTREYIILLSNDDSRVASPPNSDETKSH